MPSKFFIKESVMRIKIESDAHEIVDRIKEIDEGYFVIYNTDKGKFEVHNYKQANTYCISCPYECLDNRLLNLIFLSSVSNIDNIIEEIDRNNKDVEQEAASSVKDIGDYKAREIYKFASSSSKVFDVKKSFNEVWRW